MTSQFAALALLALACAAAGCGGDNKKASITSFTADSTSVAPGTAVTLSWVVANASTLTIDNGVGAVTGTSASVTPAQTTTYTLTAKGSGDTVGVTASVTVTVAPTVPATASAFVATPGQITAGASATLQWNVANATKVTIDNGVGDQPLTATSVTVTPGTTTTYTLTVTGAAAPQPAPLTATVRVAGAPAITAFSAAPASITLGSTTVLSWTATGARSFSLDNGIGSVGGATSWVVQPGAAGSTSYTLTAVSPAGVTTTRSTSVVATAAAGTRTLSYTDPLVVPPTAVLKLVKDASSTPAVLVLKLVTAQAVAAARALAFNLALDGSKVALDALVGGDTAAGLVVNASALNPGSSPAAAMAVIPTNGPLRNVLTLGISRKPAGGGAAPGDVALVAGTELCRFRLVPAGGAGPGPVFPLTADPMKPDPSDAYKPYKALLRGAPGSGPSSTLPGSAVALGTLTMN